MLADYSIQLDRTSYLLTLTFMWRYRQPASTSAVGAKRCSSARHRRSASWPYHSCPQTTSLVTGETAGQLQIGCLRVSGAA